MKTQSNQETSMATSIYQLPTVNDQKMTEAIQRVIDQEDPKGADRRSTMAVIRALRNRSAETNRDKS